MMNVFHHKHLSLPRHEYSDALYRRIEELRPHVKWPHINPPPAKDAPEPAHPRSIMRKQHSDHKNQMLFSIDQCMQSKRTLYRIIQNIISYLFINTARKIFLLFIKNSYLEVQDPRFHLYHI